MCDSSHHDVTMLLREVGRGDERVGSRIIGLAGEQAPPSAAFLGETIHVGLIV